LVPIAGATVIDAAVLDDGALGDAPRLSSALTVAKTVVRLWRTEGSNPSPSAGADAAEKIAHGLFADN